MWPPASPPPLAYGARCFRPRPPGPRVPALSPQALWAPRGDRKGGRARGPCAVDRGRGWLALVRLRVPDNITLLKLPPYAPELNPMENVWAYLRANKLAISVFDSYGDILNKCQDAWNFFANDPERITSITLRDWITVS